MTRTTPDLPPAAPAPRTWTEPVCTEYAVGDLTAFSVGFTNEAPGLS